MLFSSSCYLILNFLTTIYLLLSTTTADKINAAPIISIRPNVVPNNKNEKDYCCYRLKTSDYTPVTAPINLTPSKYSENDIIVPTIITPVMHKKSINVKLEGI